ncbi:isochorismatase family protein [Curvivirga sp.]|uniref:isochorismatase family protein n=1 Tax=Curvivirga sp. TaxID=2856848 RepID=UPI003B5A4879
MNQIRKGLPQIGTYSLPTLEELQEPRPDWKLSADRAALLIHDMQDYFLRPYDQQAEPMNMVLNNIQRLIGHCRKLGIPVFYTAQEVRQERCDRGLQADLWGPGMQDPENHQKIVKDLAPSEEDYVLVKHRYSAFQRSNLETMMKSRNRDQLIICGVYAHIGCLLTAGDAFMRDIEPFFVADAVADFSREKHDLAVQYVRDVCGVSCTLEQVESWL